MEKITLVCTSLNPDERLLNKMLQSAIGFDEVILHIDPFSKYYDYFINYPKSGSPIRRYFSSTHLDIAQAYNTLISQADDGWICCFCDDDYFFPELSQMIDEVHKGIDADVAHFQFRVSGHRPFKDLRSWVKGSIYYLWEDKPITVKLLEKHNRLPAGSFFRKSAWEKVGGFQGDKCHDWDLWKRMVKAGCTFKYFPYLVYDYVRREGSSWQKQN